MERLTFKPSGRSVLLTALLVVCLVETVTLLELGRVRPRAEARGATTPDRQSAEVRPAQRVPLAGQTAGVEAKSSAIQSPRSGKKGAVSPPQEDSPTCPARSIRCRGLIETRRESIPVGTLVAGVVSEVYVERGDVVKKGDPLFRLDDRDFRMQLGIATANLQVAEAQLDRLLAAPRQGDVPSAEASLEEARAHLGDAERTFRRSQTLYDRKVESAQDRDRDRYAYIASKAIVARLEAELKRTRTTWEKDKLTARATVAQAKAQVESLQVSLGRLMVHAAIDGRVLRVGVRPGQFAGTAWNEPLIVLGDCRDLVVRADVDESALPRFAPRAKAIATLKDRPGLVLPLTYFDTDPAIITQPPMDDEDSASDPRPRRVLQVLYQLPRECSIVLYAGQQMDVTIEPVDDPSTRDPGRRVPPSAPSTAVTRRDDVVR
ncbi:MAG: HlyD family secretion protein [Isosphaeraceae bacterium]